MGPFDPEIGVLENYFFNYILPSTFSALSGIPIILETRYPGLSLLKPYIAISTNLIFLSLCSNFGRLLHNCVFQTTGF